MIILVALLMIKAFLKILLVFLFCPLFFLGQNFSRPGDWKKYRKEVFISTGAAAFLGDLGGRDRVGTDNSPVDIDFNQTRTAFGAGYRFKFQRWLAGTVRFNYLRLKGDDAATKEQFRNNRNLNFKTNLFELGGRIEIGYNSSRAGNRYGIKKTLSRRMKANDHALFAFVGVSAFYFNPKAKDGTKLRPLRTEGQGLEGGPKPYSNYAVAIPFGVYYKLVIQKQWSVGLEFSWRKTFTDYIDDVSTTYYDPVKLAEAYGPNSVKYADPSLGLISGATAPDAAGNPAQRGDKNLDSYMSLEVTVGYIFKKQRRSKARLRSKF